MIGGMLIADARSIKQLNSANVVVWQSTSDVQNNWVDLALDPNTFDFWAVDAGSVWRLARYRLGGTNQLFLSLGGTVPPRGVAVNGELRAAQTIRLLNISSNCTTSSHTRLLGREFRFAVVSGRHALGPRLRHPAGAGLRRERERVARRAGSGGAKRRQ